MNQFRRYLEVYKMEEREGKWTMRDSLHRPCRLMLVLFNEKYYRRNKKGPIGLVIGFWVLFVLL